MYINDQTEHIDLNAIFEITKVAWPINNTAWVANYVNSQFAIYTCAVLLFIDTFFHVFFSTDTM